jgi:hypothetical protein
VRRNRTARVQAALKHWVVVIRALPVRRRIVGQNQQNRRHSR